MPLKYLSNFWGTLEITLIKYETNLILNCSADCFVFSATGETKFAITDTKLCVLVGTLSAQDNPELLEQLRSAFKRPNQYLDLLIDLIFQGLNRCFVLLFERNERKVNTEYYFPKVEIKDYNIMIDGKNFFCEK